ncbi:MAG: hypothetical protein INQ03_19120 [Candidatus Heimdallarchaeota archaeon]|nr:hypothetical protein [Candidatus Heimdallarchaeota archaeon]
MNLKDILRIRVIHQGLHLPERNNSNRMMISILDSAWWLGGEFGLRARLHTSIRKPYNMMQKDGMVNLLLDQAQRQMSLANYLLFTTQQKPEFKDERMDMALKTPGNLEKAELASMLEVSLRQLSSIIRKEQRNYSVIVYQNKVWHYQHFMKQGKVKIKGQYLEDLSAIELRSFMVKKILDLYPLINADQLSLLTGIHIYELAPILSNLHRRGEIKRALTRVDSPDELFMVTSREIDVDWHNTPNFVLERRDAFVDLLMLEPYFDAKGENYWYFAEGLPQAEFDLTRSGSKIYRVSSFNLLSTATQDTETILMGIREWSKYQKISLDTSIETKESLFSQLWVRTLQERGYQNQEGIFILRKFSETPNVVLRSARTIGLTWKDLSQWYKKKQLLHEHDLSVEAVLSALVQLDDIQSVAYRLGTHPDRIHISPIYGINFRKGYVTERLIQDIMLAYPKLPELRHLDRKILKHLGTDIAEMSKLVNAMESEVRQRLLYLERVRMVRRDHLSPTGTEKAKWIAFSDRVLDRGDGKKSQSALAAIILEILKNHIPLTLEQLGVWLGYPTSELVEAKQHLLRKGLLVEGYYLAFEEDIQITLPEILEELEELDTSEEIEELDPTDILPFTDPVAVFHIRRLLLQNPELSVTERFDPESDWWIILWNGEPVGYLIKIPSSQPLVDFEISIRLRNEMMTNPVISGVLQQIIRIFKGWYDDELKIRDINSIPLDNSRFESLKFLLATLGLD